MNGDGKADLILIKPNDDLVQTFSATIYLSTGTAFVAQVVNNVGDRGVAVNLVTDVNGDGNADLVRVGNFRVDPSAPPKNAILVFLSDGRALISQPAQILTVYTGTPKSHDGNGDNVTIR